ncbi:MAG TPA: hypothetical protein VL485_08235 [Ktedonobacteraceae bacterium]|jgi:hypothetical protein|nr:hypothetical protein [Ktedonobacteraceae bacterium]
MQKVYMREPKLTVNAPRLDEERIMHFSLQEALPSTHTLALNLAFGTLSYISCVADRPLLLMQEQFTNGEMSVLLPLLEAFPYYCPYEIMFAHFYNGKVSDKIIARSRQHLQAAAEEGLWDQEMRPVRSALSRTRLKLRPFGIDISSILATGYLLMISNRMPHTEEAEPSNVTVKWGKSLA